jgi:hypothetical protein
MAERKSFAFEKPLASLRISPALGNRDLHPREKIGLFDRVSSPEGYPQKNQVRSKLHESILGSRHYERLDMNSVWRHKDKQCRDYILRNASILDGLFAQTAFAQAGTLSKRPCPLLRISRLLLGARMFVPFITTKLRILVSGVIHSEALFCF